MRLVLICLLLCSVCYGQAVKSTAPLPNDPNGVASLMPLPNDSAAVSPGSHKIDWKDCQQVTEQWKAQVERFNAEHVKAGDGLQIQVGCTYSNPAPQKPQRRIALTVQEAARLNQLRRASHRNFSAQNSYEETLLKAHGIKKPEYGDPCWHFVGFVLDENFITVDPNTWSSACSIEFPAQH